MKRFAITVLLVLSAGCETFTNRLGPEVDSTRAIYSEAGGISSVLTGRVSSCTVVQSKGSPPARIQSLVFGEDKCEVVLEAEQ